MGHDNIDWKVKPVDVDESKFNAEDFGVFVFPSLIVGIGHVASGKSTLMYNLIEKFNPVFEGHVIVFSPTFENDPIGHKIKEDDMILEHFAEFSNSILMRVLEVIRDDPNKEQKYLLVFDDILGLLPKIVQSKEAKFWNNFISTYRHGGGVAHEGQLSLLFFTQYYKDLSPILRANASYVMFLGSHSEKHKKQYSEELNAVCDGSDQKFMELYHQCKADKYDIMMLDFRNLKVYKNLDQLVYSRDDQHASEDKKIDLPQEEENDEDAE